MRNGGWCPIPPIRLLCCVSNFATNVSCTVRTPEADIEAYQISFSPFMLACPFLPTMM